MVIALSAALAAASVTHLAACGLGKSRLRYFTKLLLMPLVAALYCALADRPAPAVLAAMFCGWVGDFFMIYKHKDAFLAAGVHLASSSGLNEFYSVLKGIHQRDYSAEVAGLADLFTVTYDPAMIENAIDDMIAHLNGEEVPKDHVIAVQVVDATNVNDFVGFGDAVAAE